MTSTNNASVVTIDHKNGTNVYAAPTEESAQDALLSFLTSSAP